MRMREIFDIVGRCPLTEGRDAPLYHATPLDRAVHIIKDNAILDRASVMRRMYPDDEHDENSAGMTSNWLASGEKISGVNLTRDLRFAGAYDNDVVFALDQRQLAQRHRIIPMDHARVMGKLFHGDGEWPDHTPDGSEAMELVPGPINDLNRYLLWVYAGPACRNEDAEAYAFVSKHSKFVHALPHAVR